MSIFTTIDRENITRSAHYAFTCYEFTKGTESRTEAKERRQKRDRVSATIATGLDVLESENPPKSKEEAIRRIVGVVAFLLAGIFPQYALAIKVAGWLWDYLHLESGT